jgi:hypothetical protein
VDVHGSAVCSTPGEARFFRVKGAHSQSSLSAAGLNEADLEELVVRVETLDDVLTADYSPALIKTDVEGAEYAALLGGQRTLMRHDPIVVFEHGASARRVDSSVTGEIHALMSKLGYRIFDIDGVGPMTREEFEDAAQRGRIWTFVAHK